jgi:hypothetical protein
MTIMTMMIMMNYINIIVFIVMLSFRLIKTNYLKSSISVG